MKVRESFSFKALCLFLSFLSVAASFVLYADCALAELPSLDNAESVYLYCVESKKILAQKNLNATIYPASTVKLMTGLIAAEKLADRMEETVTVTRSMISGVDGTSMKLSEGDRVRIIDLFYGAICGGYNDAANALAVICSGSVRDFVTLMNSRAAELGMSGTHYTNPTGWHDDNMYTTLSDTAVISLEVMKNELYVAASSSVSYTVPYSETTPSYSFNNRNCLISSYYGQGYVNRYARGLIAGMTDEGGYCVSTFAEYKGFTYLCIVMGATASEKTVYSYSVANSLIEYARSAFRYVEVMSEGDIICEIPVNLAMPASDAEKQLTVSAVVAKDITAAVPSEADTEKDISYKYYLYEDELNAPVKAGSIVGGIDIYYNGEIVASSSLLAASDIEANGFLVFLDKAEKAILSRTSVISLISFLVIFSIYYYFDELRHRRKKTRNIGYKNIYR